MIYEITKELAAGLKDRGCPLRVVSGQEYPSPASMTDSHIVVTRDWPAGDTVGPTKSARMNPKALLTRGINAVIRVYARSTAAGAASHDHIRLADHTVDTILICLQYIAAKRRQPIACRSMGLVTQQELQQAKVERWPGVVYDMAITVERSVFDTTFAGEAAQEVEVSAAGGDGKIIVETTSEDVNVHRVGSTHNEHPTAGGTG